MLTIRMLPSLLFALGLIVNVACSAADKNARTAYVTAEEGGVDFALQGEYAGPVVISAKQLPYGVQVIALGDGEFQAVVFPGGLPGAGGDATKKVELKGSLEDKVVSLTGEQHTATIADGVLTLMAKDGSEIAKLERIVRESDTLGMEPPEGAVVLFDGSSAEKFEKGQMTDDGLLKEGTTSIDRFQDFKLHLEFQLSFMPYARGQQRSNSGIYMQGRYECQVLDSFGLEGKNNECGGIYSIKAPDLNMCLPPLSWQTYDVEFTAAKFDDAGKKTDNARMTVLLNGVKIHDNVELPRSTTAAPVKVNPEPGPIYIQNHRNPVRFRNIWVLER